MVRAASGPLRVLLLLLAVVPMVDSGSSETLKVSSGYPGGSVTATGSGYDACQPLGVTIHVIEPYERVLTTAKVQAHGGIDETFDLPPDIALGEYKVAADCPDSDPATFGYTEFTVTAPPKPPPPPSSSATSSSAVTSSVRTSRRIPSPVVSPTVTDPVATDSTSSITGPIVDPTTHVSTDVVVTGPGPGSSSTAKSKVADWVVVIGVVGALIALTALGRRLFRGRAAPAYQPQHTTRVPVVRAVARPGVPGPVELRDHGPGQSVSIRVVVRQEPGEPVVRYSGGGRPR